MDDIQTKMDELDQEMAKALDEFNAEREKERERLDRALSALTHIKARSPEAMSLLYASMVTKEITRADHLKTSLEISARALLANDQKSIDVVTQAILVEMDFARQVIEGIRKVYFDGH
jgi:hypothetical protein